MSVPTLSLQPLVENAIHHGLARSSRGIRVEIRAGLYNGSLNISVTDNGRGLPEGFDIDSDAGTGLGNLRSRLRHSYGPDAELSLERRSEGGTIATLTLPAHRLDGSEPR